MVDVCDVCDTYDTYDTYNIYDDFDDDFYVIQHPKRVSWGNSVVVMILPDNDKKIKKIMYEFVKNNITTISFNNPEDIELYNKERTKNFQTTMYKYKNLKEVGL